MTLRAADCRVSAAPPLLRVRVRVSITGEADMVRPVRFFRYARAGCVVDAFVPIVRYIRYKCRARMIIPCFDNRGQRPRRGGHRRKAWVPQRR